MSAYYFFLSYARADRESDRHDAIGRFYTDLVEEIRLRRGARPDRIGFFDSRSIEPAESWTGELREALRTCRAFVAVLSPSYFSSEYGGREWEVFRSRLAEHAPGRRLPLIHPVLLLARRELAPLPTAVAEDVGDIQLDRDDYPLVYRREGLSYMVRLSEHRDDYTKLVTLFAKRLLETVDAHALPPAADLPPIKQVASAFHHQGTHVAATAPAPSPVGRFAQFIFVAGRRSELSALRQDVSLYGDEGGLDWRPYRPAVDDEVAIIAQDVASREKLRYEAVPVDAALARRLDAAAANRKIVVVIADAWTVRLEAYHLLMRELDRRNLPNCVVLVPWNLEDGETAANRDALEAALQYTFVNRYAQGKADAFFDRIFSPGELREEISKALTSARSKLLQIEDVRRRAESERVIVQPVVVGPGGSP